jgi:dihydropteroate synthase
MLRPPFTWKLRSRSLELGAHTLVMAVVNVTPDSFSDGGQYFSEDLAVFRALEALDQGADILDLGGESTRPGRREPVSADDEIARVLPVVQRVLHRRPNAVISVDTYKATVARAAVVAGAEIINDVCAGQWDPQMLPTLAEQACGAVLMHTRGRPEEWRNQPRLDGDALTDLVSRELRARADAALQAGIERDRIVLDPGFGFGKNFEENYGLLARFSRLNALGFPLLSGTSRKSFLGRTLARNGQDAPPNQRLMGTLATVTASVLAGAHIVRVHDVPEVIQAVRIADAILAAG